MPVYERSYRHWDGALHAGGGRWLPIAAAGLRHALRARATVLRSLIFYIFLLGSLVPFVVLFLLNYGYHFPPMDFMSEEALGLLDQLAVYRVVQYSVLMVYSAPLLLLWAVLFGSATIAQDRAALSLPLYLSRPLTLRDYLCGKFAVVFVMLSLLTFVPCGLIWALDVFATDADGYWRTALRNGFGILVHCSVLVGIHGSAILAASAVCRRPMMAGALWFGVATAGLFLSALLRANLGIEKTAVLDVNQVAMTLAYAAFDFEQLDEIPGALTLIRNFGVQSYAPVSWCAAAAVVWVVGSWWVLVRAVRRHHRDSQG